MTLIQDPRDPQHAGEPPVDVDETSLEKREVAGLSQSQIVRRRFFRHKGAMVSLILLLLIVALAATSIGWGPIPHWWRWGYDEVVPPNPNQGPRARPSSASSVASRCHRSRCSMHRARSGRSTNAS